MDNQDFLDIMAVLEAAFGPQDRVKHQLYWSLTKDLPPEHLRAAAIQCIRDLTQFPTVKHLIDRLPGQLSESDEAEAAWIRVINEAENGLRTPYNPHSPSVLTGGGLPDRERMAVSQAGGLSAIEDEPTRIGFIRRDFLANYKALAHIEIHKPAALPPGYVRGQGIKMLGDCLDSRPPPGGGERA